MTREQRAFVRIYYVDLERDYPAVWFGPALATYTRMLKISDQSWPNPAPLPTGTSKADLRLLTSSGLVALLDNHRYIIKGYERERQERRDKALRALNSRNDRTTDVPTNVPTHVPTSVGHTREDTGTGSNSLVGEGSGEGLPNIHPEASHFLEEATGRSARQAGDKQLAEYDRQIADHGFPKVKAAWIAARKGLPSSPKPTARQLVWSAMKLMEPFADPKAVAQEITRTDEAAERAKKHERLMASMHSRRVEMYRYRGHWEPEWGEPPKWDPAWGTSPESAA